MDTILTGVASPCHTSCMDAYDRPAAGEDSATASWSRAKVDNVVYDLRIWNAEDDAPRALVYERQGLLQSLYQVEAALDSGTTYFGSVRMRHGAGGHPRVTLWGAANRPRFHLSNPLRDARFHPRIEDAMLKRVCVPTAT